MFACYVLTIPLTHNFNREMMGGGGGGGACNGITTTHVCTPHIMWLDPMKADRVQRMRGEERIQEGSDGSKPHLC